MQSASLCIAVPPESIISNFSRILKILKPRWREEKNVA